MSGLKLLISDNRGIYIPQEFAEFNHFNRLFNIDEDDADLVILREGPDSDYYWDAWDSVISRATYTDSQGNNWYLHQDGDLWLFCGKLMTDEEYSNFFGEDRDHE
jgi:hypothetical protein